jgi:hypothetical protein
MGSSGDPDGDTAPRGHDAAAVTKNNA